MTSRSLRAELAPATTGVLKPSQDNQQQTHDPGTWGHPAAFNMCLRCFGMVGCTFLLLQTGISGCAPLCAMELHNFQTENRGWEGKAKLCRELMLCWEQTPECSGELVVQAGRGFGVPGWAPCPAVRCSEAAATKVVQGPLCPSSLPAEGRFSLWGHPGQCDPSLQPSCPCLALRQGGKRQD